MARENTHTTYGSVTKSFHWLTALLILSMIPLGFIANNLAYQIKDPSIPSTGEDIARVAWLFSLHKTVGVALFFTALLRIGWAISQPKPKLLNGDKTLEAWAAVTVHWMLYSSLVIVPLSGWVHHAATTGFAPIWWPFGQSLPFVPKDQVLADQTATLHMVSVFVMMGSLGLHIAGALKHHVIDKDATLKRMLPGVTSADAPTKQPGEVVPVFAAASVWAAVIFVGSALTLTEAPVEAEVAELESVDSQWAVTGGDLTLSITQFGSTVEGEFSDWTAAIDYLETPDSDGKHGTVTVTVNIASLELGSVTNQAKDPAYLDVENHPTAVFEADILAKDAGHVALGTLTLKGHRVPVEMPFDLVLDGDIATAAGALTLDRRDFLVGMGTTNETNLGFAVDVAFTLQATRGAVEEEEPQIAQTFDGWAVSEGELNLEVSQFGSTVNGSFADWTADIDYEETPDDSGKHGTVAVTINVASLALGSVTDQAKGADYFDLENHPTALFEADILASETGHVAEGVLTIKDQSIPIQMPFDLTLDGNTARASGSLSVDRRDFLIGMGTTDEATLGFGVAISFSLTAERGEPAAVPVEEAKLDPPAHAWIVDAGTLGISVNQFGNAVQGSFAKWTADIRYDDEANDAEPRGHVEVMIDIASLTLGSVTDQAKGPDYFDTGVHPNAVFAADILASEGGHIASGTLTIKDQSVPVSMPVDLIIEGDKAIASGALRVDRRDFLIGMGTTDEATLGFAVSIEFEVTALRAQTLTSNQN